MSMKKVLFIPTNSMGRNEDITLIMASVTITARYNCGYLKYKSTVRIRASSITMREILRTSNIVSFMKDLL